MAEDLSSWRGAIDALVREGYSETVLWNTWLFHRDPCVKRCFNHKNYGFQQRREANLAFVKNVTRGDTLWFRGGLNPEKRARTLLEKLQNDRNLLRTEDEKLACEKTRFNVIVSHDLAYLKKDEGTGEWSLGTEEGGFKMYGLVSVWQLLHKLGKTFYDRAEETIRLMRQNVVVSAKSSKCSEEWVENGQPLASSWPSCALYNSRFDPPNSDYLMTIDVDGKHLMTSEEIKTKDGQRVIRIFEVEIAENRCAALQDFTSSIKECFSQFYDVRVQVAWHKSIGWKPSWRGYVLGVRFYNTYEAKGFTQRCLLPTLCDKSWYVDGVVDDRTFCKGWDRILGSAKLLTSNSGDMRPLDFSPLRNVTDTKLIEMFDKCPNQYIMSCLGWIYPETFLKGEAPKLLRAPQGWNPKPKKRNADETFRTPTPRVVESSGATSEMEKLISKKISEITKTNTVWTSVKTIKLSTEGRVETSATNDSFFCVHRQCEAYRQDTVRRLTSRPPHTHNPRKISFSADVLPDENGRMFLRQYCFSCKERCKDYWKNVVVCRLTDEDVTALRRAMCPRDDENIDVEVEDLC